VSSYEFIIKEQINAYAFPGVIIMKFSLKNYSRINMLKPRDYHYSHSENDLMRLTWNCSKCRKGSFYKHRFHLIKTIPSLNYTRIQRPWIWICKLYYLYIRYRVGTLLLVAAYAHNCDFCIKYPKNAHNFINSMRENVYSYYTLNPSCIQPNKCPQTIPSHLNSLRLNWTNNNNNLNNKVGWNHSALSFFKKSKFH
jgi:hypothetical protein